MMGTLRTHKGLQSNVLSPTSNKLPAQFEILNHLNNHYRKIQNVKSCIDTSQPKSLSCSQKIRDRQKREQLKKARAQSAVMRHLSASRPLSRMTDGDIYENTFENPPESEEDKMVYDIMKESFLQQNSFIDCHPHHSRERMSPLPRQTPKSMYDSMYGRSASVRSTFSVKSMASQPSTSRKVHTADLLETQPEVFTEPEKPFMPRILISNRSSVLSRYRYYNPPRKHKLKKTDGASECSHPDLSQPTTISKPALKQQQIKTLPEKPEVHQKTRTTFTADNKNVPGEKAARNQSLRKAVPPLAISVDVDHKKWMQKQDAKGRSEDKDSHRSITFLAQESDKSMVVTTHRKANKILDTSSEQPARISGSLSRQAITCDNVGNLVADEEYNSEYLQFITCVTQDVLARRIFTNRALEQIFESHVEKRKYQLDEEKMRKLLNNLRQELGIPESGRSILKNHHKNSGAVTKETDDKHVHDSLDAVDGGVDTQIGGATQLIDGSFEFENSSCLDETLLQRDQVMPSSPGNLRDVAISELANTGSLEQQNKDKLPASPIQDQYQYNLMMKEREDEKCVKTETAVAHPVPRPRPRKQTRSKVESTLQNLISDCSLSDKNNCDQVNNKSCSNEHPNFTNEEETNLSPHSLATESNVCQTKNKSGLTGNFDYKETEASSQDFNNENDSRSSISQQNESQSNECPDVKETKELLCDHSGANKSPKLRPENQSKDNSYLKETGVLHHHLSDADNCRQPRTESSSRECFDVGKNGVFLTTLSSSQGLLKLMESTVSEHTKENSVVNEDFEGIYDNDDFEEDETDQCSEESDNF